MCFFVFIGYEFLRGDVFFFFVVRSFGLVLSGVCIGGFVEVILKRGFDGKWLFGKGFSEIFVGDGEAR